MIRRGLTLASLLTLAACATMAPPNDRPPAPVPPSWPVGDAYLRQNEAALPSVSYRDIFRDPRLQALIEQALVNNRDLRIAAANIAAARGAYRAQRGQQFPTVTAGAGATAQRGGAQAAAIPGGTAGGPRTFEIYQADVGVTAFELDLFGRVRSLARAELETYFATEAAARATRLTLVGDIADAWLAYAADRSLLQIAEQTAKNAADSVRLTRLRLEGGVVPRTDVRQAELIEAQARSDLAAQRTRLAQDINLLQLLVGAPIDTANLPESIDRVAPSLAELPAGLSSEILLRRPDVVQAEYQLRSANARIGAARAALFPRISLTGLLGFASTSLGSLFTGDAFTWSAGGNVDYNIFDGGTARGNLLTSRAQRDAAVATYERTIQTAFREVSDALARRGTIADQEAAQQRLVASALDNYNLSNARYRGGIDTFLQTLDAQRSLYTAQQSQVATQLERAQNLVALYRTLGGDAGLDVTDDGPRAVSPEPTATPVPRTR